MNQLSTLVDLTVKQTEAACKFLTVIDTLNVISINANTETVKELVHSTASFIMLANNIFVDTASAIMDSYEEEDEEDATEDGLTIINDPEGSVHSLNVEELDADYEEYEDE